MTGPVDTCAVVSTDAFRACVEEVAADNGVDAVLAVAVPTAFSDLSAAVAEAVVSKPLAVALLDRAESVRRLKRLPVPPPPSGSHPDTGAAGDPPAAAPSAADPAAAGRAAAVIDVAAAAVTGVPCTPTPIMRPALWATQSGTGPGAGGSAARSPSWKDCARPTRGPWSPVSWPARRTAVLPEARAAELMSCNGIPRVATMAAATEEEAAGAAAQLGGRVVLKAEAEGLVHRTDAGGVKVDLRTPQKWPKVTGRWRPTSGRG